MQGLKWLRNIRSYKLSSPARNCSESTSNSWSVNPKFRLSVMSTKSVVLRRCDQILSGKCKLRFKWFWWFWWFETFDLKGWSNRDIQKHLAFLSVKRQAGIGICPGPVHRPTNIESPKGLDVTKKVKKVKQKFSGKKWQALSQKLLEWILLAMPGNWN